jgi:nucleotide-binding universal stress UspA family protein
MQSRVDQQALTSAQIYIDDLLPRLWHGGQPAAGRVLTGQPGPTIASAARRLKVDLICMSTHAHLAPLRGLLGSTADEVVRTAYTPVLLVRRRAHLES